jgi:hypothetical protein
MDLFNRFSTGMFGFDKVIGHLRWGDNVVWQVDSIADYKWVAEPFVAQAKLDKRSLVYVRFGRHEPVVEDSPEIKSYFFDAKKGFESFATEIHEMITREGRKLFICSTADRPAEILVLRSDDRQLL